MDNLDFVIPIDEFSVFSILDNYYLFVDAQSYLADNLFIKHKVRVAFLDEYSDGSDYVVIICRVKKWNTKKFLAALSELPDKMAICGYTDYLSYCRELKEKVLSGDEEGVDDEEN